jgi:hypothetical protein
MKVKEYTTSFKNHNEYLAFKESENFVIPNVSYCNDEKHVHYNGYPKPIGDVIITYSVTSTTEPTTIYQFDSWEPEPWFDETIEIDGVKSSGHTLTHEEGVDSIIFSTTGLHTIKFKPTSTIIGKRAFWAIDYIVEAYIPEGITRINDEVFDYSPSMTAITLPSTLEYIGVRSIQDTGLEELRIPANAEIASYALMDNRVLKTLVIEDGIETFGMFAARSCVELENLTLPSTLKNTGKYTFALCSKLEDVTLPSGLKEIDVETFASCGLTAITIPNTVERIYNGAFGNCQKLESVTFEETPHVTVMDYRVFYNCKSLNYVELPNSITALGAAIFESSSVSAVTLPERITDIKYSMFKDCKSLTGVTIPTGVTKIERGAFSGCTAIETLILPQNLTTIEDEAFGGMTSLTRITIPQNVTSIGASAFTKTSSLEEITLEGLTVPTLGADAFKNAKAGFNIFVPCELVSDYQEADGWKTYKNNIKAIPGYTCNTVKGYCDVSHYSSIPCNCSLILTADEIPNKERLYYFETAVITSLEAGCFSGMTDMTGLSMSNSAIKSIPSACCKGTGLYYVNLPDSLETVAINAFSGCTSLSDITFGANVESLGRNAFAGCTALTAITFTTLEPPTITATTFPKESGEYTNFTIYVPAEAVETYKTYDTVWQGLANKIQAKP